MVARSYLYVPGDRPDRFAKACVSGAQAVVLDLEDAVAVTAKTAARAHVVEYLANGVRDVELWVRINVGDHGLQDLSAVASCASLAGVFVAKAAVEQLCAIAATAPDVQCVALVEDAAVLVDLGALARLPNVVALAAGDVDLAADLRITLSPDGRELDAARWQLVVHSAASRLWPPIGPVSLAIDDLGELYRSTRELRRRGFGARQVIHPAQVEPVNGALTPDADEVERARRLLAQAEVAAGGALVADGRMIDEAVLRHARAVVEASAQ